MSRTLAALLGAPELPFRARIGQLEQASGAPAADVRLTAELIQLNQQKLKALGLDTRDTTGPELYAALNQRYLDDNEVLTLALDRERQVAGDDVMASVKFALSQLELPNQCLVLKPAVVKRLLKAIPPKTTMRQLGYRSLESLLKHESAAALLATAQLIESATWQHQLYRQAGQLEVTDFELKPLNVVYEPHERWQKLAQATAIHKKHHVVAAPLSASLVLLPYGDQQPPAALLTTLVMAVTAINQIAAASSYLKLHQMRPDFATTVQSLVGQQTAPLLELLHEPISWHLIHRYYSRFMEYYRPELFEPYLQPEDFSWLAADAVLADWAPHLAFWQHNAHAGMATEDAAVSYNLHDVALNACNQLPYEQRVNHHFKEALWQELLFHYLRPANVEKAVAERMQPAMSEISV